MKVVKSIVISSSVEGLSFLRLLLDTIVNQCLHRKLQELVPKGSYNFLTPPIAYIECHSIPIHSH